MNNPLFFRWKISLKNHSFHEYIRLVIWQFAWMLINKVVLSICLSLFLYICLIKKKEKCEFISHFADIIQLYSQER